jgi:hypothetical protein
VDTDQRRGKLTKNIFKKLLHRIDEYWNDLNTKSDNEKINEAKQEIILLIYIFCFAISSLLVLYVSDLYYKKIGEELHSLAFFFTVIIFLIWASAILHTKKIHKHHSHHVQVENSQ